MKTYLYSCGGSGYTYLKHLLNWHDPTVHNPHQRISVLGQGVKFVYVFANPYDVLLSFEKRGYLNNVNAVGLLQGDVNYFRAHGCKGLDHYLDLETDCFMFGHHFNSYYTNAGTGLFVKYEALADKLEAMREWAGVEYIQKIPFAKRTSDYANLPAEKRDKLRARHGRWFDHCQRLPSFFTNRPFNQEFVYPYLSDSHADMQPGSASYEDRA
jgi:hypothetical protein